jgi:hypothetical protein
MPRTTRLERDPQPAGCGQVGKHLDSEVHQVQQSAADPMPSAGRRVASLALSQPLNLSSATSPRGVALRDVALRDVIAGADPLGAWRVELCGLGLASRSW